jgi:hypothetical protein
MNEAAEVFLWGRRIGVVSRIEGKPFAAFAGLTGKDMDKRSVQSAGSGA